jgi:hypothetical protein
LPNASPWIAFGLRPTAWVKGCEAETLSIRALKTGLSLTAALAWEALLTAQCFVDQGKNSVRGGPWCRVVLPATDLKELKECAKATSVADVRRIADLFSEGSLALHLAGRPYAAVAKPSRGHVPCLPLKRPSGRSGRSGKSGASGNTYRKAKGLAYGDAAYARHKWGKSPVAARSKHLRDHRLRGKSAPTGARAPPSRGNHPRGRKIASKRLPASAWSFLVRLGKTNLPGAASSQ